MSLWQDRVGLAGTNHFEIFWYLWGRGLLRRFLVLFRSSRKCRNIILIYWTLVDIVPPCPAILLRDMARIGVGLAEGDVLEFSESEIYHLLKHLETLGKIRNFHKISKVPLQQIQVGVRFFISISLDDKQVLLSHQADDKQVLFLFQTTSLFQL